MWAVLDATEKDGDTEKPLIVAVKPVQDRVEVNIITSTYGKDTDFIRRETEKGNLLYKRKKTISNQHRSFNCYGDFETVYKHYNKFLTRFKA